MTPLLETEALSVRFRVGGRELAALDRVSLRLEEGQAFGVVGESGCGKTTLLRAILRLLPPNGRIAGGQVRFRGIDLVALPEQAMRERRWRDIALVTQSAMNGLDPVYRVGAQIVEAIQAHRKMSARAAWQRAEELFAVVGLQPDWTRRYPHELSGGMRQRAIIAMALSLDPPLIIADEPTTALDVIVQDQIFDEIGRIRAARATGLMLITHDISLVAENCDVVAVMYAGVIVEFAPAAELFAAPRHPYTMGLQNAFVDLEGDVRLISIPGAPPDLTDPPVGCRFAPRCPFATEECRRVAPPLRPIGEGHFVACHYAEQAGPRRAAAAIQATWDRVAERVGAAA